MRRLLTPTATILALVAAATLSGCGAKQTATDSTASSDSLLASNPVEQPSGSITPQSEYPASEQQQTPPSEPATKPASQKPRTTAPERPASHAVAKKTGVMIEPGTALSVS